MSKPPILFSPRWWRTMAAIFRAGREAGRRPRYEPQPRAEKPPPMQTACTALGENALVVRCREFRRIKRTRHEGLFGLFGLKLVRVPRCSACGQAVTINAELNDVIHGGNFDRRLREWMA